MNEVGVDKLNIGLILFSFLIALFFPFELFLFSYAFLGPIHYLTEINWLHQKNYFIKTNSKWMLLFVAFTTILTLILLLKNFDLIKSSNLFSYKILLLTGFFFSASLLFVKKNVQLLLSLLVSYIISLIFKQTIPVGYYFLGLFLPTIIHVYFFTFAFMLYGSLKNKSKYGFIAIISLLLIPFSIVFLPLNELNYSISNSVFKTFEESGFGKVSESIAWFFGIRELDLISVIGIKIQVFIAFAYTYHYLNWFSKTNIIGWKKDLSKQKIILLILIWIGSVGLYLYDFKTGLIALFFLSILHVFLEFPLNIVSIRESYFLLKRKF